MQDNIATKWVYFNKSGSVTLEEVSDIYECLDCSLQFGGQKNCPDCERKRNNYTRRDRRIKVISKDFPIAKQSISKNYNHKLDKELVTNQYWVLFETRELYDPYARQINYDKRNWKFRLVSESIFRLYLEYLGYGSPANKNKYYVKTKAERMMR